MHGASGPEPTLPLVDLATGSDDRPALEMGGVTVGRGELRRLVATFAAKLGPHGGWRPPGSGPGDGDGDGDGDTHAMAAVESAGVLAVPAVARVETVVAVLAGLHVGMAVMPVNVGGGPDELAHVVGDSRPRLVATAADLDLPGPLAGLPRLDVTLGPATDVTETDEATAHRHHDDPDGDHGASGPPAEHPAMVVYTSGTTGPPKGVVLSHRALAHDLDALSRAWQLTHADVLVQSLPLFHVHGLVLGVLGPLRSGASVVHQGRFDAVRTATAFEQGATVFYGVPTMYHRLADAIETDAALADALSRARLLVSGSAGLPAHDRSRITKATGTAVLERYGMTETLITCAMTVGGGHEPGTVGPALAGVELRLVDDDASTIDPRDHQTVGEIEVRGATLFAGYLHRPDATAACFTADGWFRTGDLATWADGSAVRIAGRRSQDLIKTGGYRVGAGEVENALLSHPKVAEAAVTAEPDDDLGERIVAWVVPVEAGTTAAELIDHVARHLATHKRPRRVHFVADLPRNELGKVQKRLLRADTIESRAQSPNR